MYNMFNISSFLIGVSTAFFAACSLYILVLHRERTRFQSVLGWIMAVWAVWNMKDIVITFPDMYTQRVLDWIMLIDGFSALTYTIFIFEVTMPVWTRLSRVLLLALPFALFTVAYGISPTQRVIYAYIVFLWCYAWGVVITGYVKVRRYLNYIRRNYSNIEHIDISWLKPVFLFAIISQLSWLFTSLYASVFIDILYYLSTLVLWTMVLHYSWHFQPVSIPVELAVNLGTDTPLAISREAFVNKVVSRELYLNKNLTINDLARFMRTNRTYMGRYLSGVCEQSFYDFINQLRIEKKSIPLMRDHPEYTLEYIASESGFSSISTFRRAFYKFTGKTPSQYTF
jgi:AraC-like DNA-binding protein